MDVRDPRPDVSPNPNTEPTHYAGGQYGAREGPGIKPGTAGGYMGPGAAAAMGQPVVGPGFGPGGANAPGESMDRLNRLSNPLPSVATLRRTPQVVTYVQPAA